MCDCGYRYRIPITCIPRFGKYTYTKFPNRTPTINWHSKTERPSQFVFRTNGSYAGRHKQNSCSKNY